MNICFSVHNPSLRYTITTTTKHFIPKQVGVGNGEHFHVTDILLFCKNFVAFVVIVVCWLEAKYVLHSMTKCTIIQLGFWKMIHEYCGNSEYSIGISTIWNGSLLLDKLLLTVVHRDCFPRPALYSNPEK
jgi:hypothetical protein